MTGPSPTPPQPGVGAAFAARVIFKAAILFIGLNGLFALTNPLPALSRLSVYNTLVPGRARLPFGENPDQAYNLSLYQLDAMFASHEVAVPPRPGEYRVLLIGDSSVWGILLRPQDTLAGQLNRMHLTAPDGRSVRVYNLGYPTLSATKDLMILQRAMQTRPDLIVWLVTLESLPLRKQLSSPIVQNNAAEVRALIRAYHLSLNPADPALVDPSLWDRTLVGQRRSLADVIRLNLYGVDWAATGIDQFYPAQYERAQRDLEPDSSYYDLQRPLARPDLSLDVLEAGMRLAAGTPVIVVNEPILISTGANSDLRYDFYYPRWAYDDYRRLMAAEAQQQGWRYLDVWDVVPQGEFTNSAIHLTPAGMALLAQRVGLAIAGPQASR